MRIKPILPGRFIFDLYSKHTTNLFSANVRDYLGSRESDSNINNGIKETAEYAPEKFWVFNNGLTALVHSLRTKEHAKGIDLIINGISIVNGAQTTGAIGSLRHSPALDLMVPVRFIWTADEDLVQDIIRFNNSQNKISASDFRSTDAVQKRIKQEFDKIPGAEYEGGRRGGASDAIKRRPNLMPSYTVGQALAAFHGDPATSYDRKSDIWVSDRIYSSLFKEETTAKHIVFAYALYQAAGAKKLELIGKQKNGVDLTQIEHEQLEFFEKKGAIPLVSAAFSGCLEVILGRAIPNKFRLSFGDRVTPKRAQKYWSDVSVPMFSLITQLNPAFSANRINSEAFKSAAPLFRNVISSIRSPNAAVFDAFAAVVRVD